MIPPLSEPERLARLMEQWDDAVARWAAAGEDAGSLSHAGGYLHATGNRLRDSIVALLRQHSTPRFSDEQVGREMMRETVSQGHAEAATDALSWVRDAESRLAGGSVGGTPREQGLHRCRRCGSYTVLACSSCGTPYGVVGETTFTCGRGSSVVGETPRRDWTNTGVPICPRCGFGDPDEPSVVGGETPSPDREVLARAIRYAMTDCPPIWLATADDVIARLWPKENQT